MNIILNGLPESIADATTVAALAASKGLPTQGIAIALNGEVVRSAFWPEARLGDGDVVDIVTARQGG